MIINLIKTLPLLLVAGLCNQVDVTSTKTTLHPTPPSLDSLISICTFSLTKLDRVPFSKEQGGADYYNEKQLFNGWACSVDTAIVHKYRFAFLKYGKIIRQIGYYSNSQVDFDFSTKNGMSIGSERMWRFDGGIYVKNYFISPGIKHDTQLSYHNNGKMSRLEVYDSGKLLEKVHWDTLGRIRP